MYRLALFVSLLLFCSMSLAAPVDIKTAQKAAEILKVNVFSLLGTDALRIVPLTEEDKNALIEVIKGL